MNLDGGYMATFQERFVLLKQEKGVSQEEIAECVGISRSQLGRIVMGKFRLNSSMLKKLSDYFDVDQAYLLGESDIRRQKYSVPEIYIEVAKSAVNKKVPAKVLLDFIKLYTTRSE